MALTQIFPLTLIDSVKGPVVKNWPAGPAVYFELNASQFTNPAHTVKISMQLSWNNGATWPYIKEVVWSGGAPPPRGGGPIYFLRLGPFMVGNGSGGQIEDRPNKIQFMATPIAGTPTIGLLGEVL